MGVGTVGFAVEFGVHLALGVVPVIVGVAGVRLPIQLGVHLALGVVPVIVGVAGRRLTVHKAFQHLALICAQTLVGGRAGQVVLHAAPGVGVRELCIRRHTLAQRVGHSDRHTILEVYALRSRTRVLVQFVG